MRLKTTGNTIVRNTYMYMSLKIKLQKYRKQSGVEKYDLDLTIPRAGAG